MMKSILIILISFALVVSGASQTRNVVVGTNGAVVQPTNFWSADASNARTGLGLGDSATNPASAFQSSSSVLSNLASSNAVNLTNVRATNIVGGIALASNVSGIVSIANGGTGGSTAGEARSNLAVQPASVVLSNLSSGNGSDLTNISISNLATISISGGGTGATNAATARTNLGIGATWLTNTNVTNFRTAVGLGSEDNVFFNNVETENNIIVGGDLYVTNAISVGENGITFSSGSDSVTRSNLGLGWSALTNTNTGTGLVSVNTNGEVVSPTNFWQVAPIQTLVQTFAQVTNSTNAATNARNLYVYSLATNIINVTNTITLPTNTSAFDGDEITVIHRGGSNSVTTVRQLGSTNNFISLNLYDEAVKFIKDGNWNFYHNISFTEAISFSGTNASANTAASRTNLGLGSTNNVEFQQITTDSIIMPKTGAPLVTMLTSGGSLNASIGGIIVSPSPPTVSIASSYKLELNSGATLNFAGGNSISNAPTINFANTTNAAQTRTNLGLGATNNVTFSNIIVGSFGSGSDTGFVARNSDGTLRLRGTNVTTSVPAFFGWNGNESTAMSAEVSRTNLGIPLAALTNTNNATFQEAIFTTNTAPTNAGNFGNNVAWMGVSIVTNGVTNTFLIPLYK